MTPKKLSMDDVATLIMQHAKRRGRHIPHSLSREIADLVIQTAITQAIETGTFKFTNGWGRLRLKLMKITGRKMPGGQMSETRARGVVRYDEGDLVRDLLGVERREGDYQPVPGSSSRNQLLVRHGELVP